MNILFIIIIFLAIAIMLFSIISSKNKIFKSTKLISFLYILVTAFIVGIVGFLGNKTILDISYSMIFYLLSAWMLIIGILHVMLIGKLLPWHSEDKNLTGIFFTIIIGLAGGIFLMLVFQISKFKFFTVINLTSLFLFLLPYLFYECLESYLRIPVKVLRKWHYPYEQHVEEPHEREMESPLAVGFEFKKKTNDDNITSFRAKAPKEMVFGKLFYYFINDYNDRNPDEKIEFLDENKKPVSWIFYIKPKLFGSIRYIDPEETNSFNFIKENNIIVCKRVIEK